ncbi:cupredoxin domain-containing protein [Candidatus Nitrospira bockiana]
MSLRRIVSFLPMLCGFALLVPFGMADSPPGTETVQEQRIELVIRNYEFVLTQPSPIRLNTPTVIILRNQDIVRHGFTSPMLSQLSVHGEGEGIAAYGRGIEGFYVDPGKTVVIRFSNDRPGNHTFRCDLHPQMKGELFSLEVPAA